MYHILCRSIRIRPGATGSQQHQPNGGEFDVIWKYRQFSLVYTDEYRVIPEQDRYIPEKTAESTIGAVLSRL